MAKNDDLPTFQDDQVYLLTGKVLNQIKDAIIKEIQVDPRFFAVQDIRPNKVYLTFAGGEREVEDCEGSTFTVLTKPDVEGE